MAWGIVYFKVKGGRVPAEDFLDVAQQKVEARFHAVLEAVRDAPPPQFSGGGYWEAMHGDMGGFHEIPSPVLDVANIGFSAFSTTPIQTDCGNAVSTNPKSPSLLGWSRTPVRSSPTATTPKSALGDQYMKPSSRVTSRPEPT